MPSVVEDGRKDVRLVTMISPKMDDAIIDMAEMKGLSKSEIVRNALAEYLFSQKMAVKMVGDALKESVVEAIKEELKNQGFGTEK